MQIYSGRKVTRLIKIHMQIFQWKYREQDQVQTKITLIIQQTAYSNNSSKFKGEACPTPKVSIEQLYPNVLVEFKS